MLCFVVLFEIYLLQEIWDTIQGENQQQQSRAANQLGL